MRKAPQFKLREGEGQEVYDYIYQDEVRASIQVFPNGTAGYWFDRQEKAIPANSLMAAKIAVLSKLKGV